MGPYILPYVHFWLFSRWFARPITEHAQKLFDTYPSSGTVSRFKPQLKSLYFPNTAGNASDPKRIHTARCQLISVSV